MYVDGLLQRLVNGTGTEQSTQFLRILIFANSVASTTNLPDTPSQSYKSVHFARSVLSRNPNSLFDPYLPSPESDKDSRDYRHRSFRTALRYTGDSIRSKARSPSRPCLGY